MSEAVIPPWPHSRDADQRREMAVAVSQGVNFDATCCSRDSVCEHRRPRLNKNGLAIVPSGSKEHLESS